MFDAFQLLSPSLFLIGFLKTFSLPVFPIAFNLTPILSLSLYNGLSSFFSFFLQSLQSCPATVIVLQGDPEKRNGQQNKTAREKRDKVIEM